MSFVFNFDFLTQEQNERFAESVEFFAGLELERLRDGYEALRRRCAVLEGRCLRLKDDRRMLKEELEACRGRLAAVAGVDEVEAMAGRVGRLDGELRGYRDFVKRLIRIVETAPKEVFEDEEG